MKDALIELINRIDDDWIIEYLYRYILARFDI